MSTPALRLLTPEERACMTDYDYAALAPGVWLYVLGKWLVVERKVVHVGRPVAVYVAEPTDPPPYPPK